MARVRKPDANSQDDRAGYPNTNLGNGQTVRFNRGYPSIAAEIARRGDLPVRADWVAKVRQ